VDVFQVRHRFLAVRGSVELVEEAGGRGLGPELIPLVAHSVKEALALKDPQVHTQCSLNFT
jgi:hypothetical protein